MKKCDIIIPVYNSPEWVKLCTYALFKNTPDEYIGKVIFMNDNSTDETTLNCLINLRRKYGNKIIIKSNDENVGFVKNVNMGLDLTDAEYVLLLNTDCLLSKNTIPKLMAYMQSDKNIGLICPISSNAANLSLDIFEGYSYMQVNEILEKNFSGMIFDACTVVGNCLLISRECLNRVGKLDEIYGTGYGEETDYQFKAHEKGFFAKVAIDTYVYHKSEVSFGNSKEKKEKQAKNSKIFFDRWGEQYNKKMALYLQNDPIKYIKTNLKLEKIKRPDVLIFLPDIHNGAGGVNVIVDIVNYLNINGMYANILTERIHEYNEIMLFKPCFMEDINNISPNCIVGSIYPTIFFCNTISNHYNIPSVNFMQGYEPCFDNGSVYSWAELACRSSQNILTISKFLKEKCKVNFNKEAEVIPNGINLDLLYNNSINKKNEKKYVTLVFRNNFPKGDFILVELLKKLTLKNYNIEINVIYQKEILFPINNSSIKINMYKGPLPRSEFSKILFNTDIYIDTSILEGFGLIALETMAAGAVPIISQSFGILEYAKDGKNAFVINEINNVDRYMEKIEYLLANNEILQNMKIQAQNTALKFDFDNNISKYMNYFKNVKRKDVKLTKNEEIEAKRWIVDDKMIFEKNYIEKQALENASFSRKIVILFLKLFPKSFKEKVKKILKNK